MSKRTTKVPTPNVAVEAETKLSKPELLLGLNRELDELNLQAKFDELKDRLEYYRGKAEHAETVMKSMRQERGAFREIVGELVNAVQAIQPYDRRNYNPGNVGQVTPVAPLIKLSDWQTGEVINAKETEGFGEFNWEIEQKRVLKLREKVLDWVTMHRNAGFPIDELHIFSEGDIVSGNIHYELEVTNEFPVTEATAKAGLLLADLTSALAAHFQKVTLWEMTADNHGRLTHKNQFKQGAINNYGYLAHVIANTALSKHSNVEIVQSPGTTLLASVMGKRFLIKHGHTVKAWMGIPFYGLEREKGREAAKRMNTTKTFDYISIGHWHVPSAMWGLFINGSLPGTTELDHALGRFAPPSQVSMMVHPKYGVFNYTPWRLDASRTTI